MYFHVQNMSILDDFPRQDLSFWVISPGRLNYVLRLSYDNVDSSLKVIDTRLFSTTGCGIFQPNLAISSGLGMPQLQYLKEVQYSQCLRATVIGTWDASRFPSPISLHKINKQNLHTLAILIFMELYVPENFC